MLQKIYTMAYLGLSFTMGNGFAAEFITGSAFGAEKCSPPSTVVLQRSIPKVQPQSFYGLVTALKLDHKIFSDPERLKCFGDINIRYNGFTPLHILIQRSDATIGQVKALLDCGANLNIPALVKIDGRSEIGVWNSHKIGFVFTGPTPPEVCENKSILNQFLFFPYYGNPKVIDYIFQEMLGQKIQKEIEKAKRENRLEKDSQEVFIVPGPSHSHNWQEMGDDEAREFLKESVKDQKEFERFVSNLPSGAFDVFLSMQEMTQ